MDFYGRGYITEEDFLNSIVITRISFSSEDVKEFLKQFNLFHSLNVMAGSGLTASASSSKGSPFKQLPSTP